MTRLVVLGQGYVGLPLALRAASVGFDVVAFDVNEERVSRLQAGTTYIDDVTDDDLREALDSGRFHPSADEASLEGFDIAVISVPTPLRDGSPDLQYIESAGSIVAPWVTSGSCVILESTTYPGTTEDVLVPILEQRCGLRAGVDFSVGYSPERIDPGNAQWQLHNTPKIVSGINASSLEVVDAFFSKIVERTVPVPGMKEAELAKLLENTFRHVNIALVNELAIYAHGLGVDVWSVIDAAASKPFGFMRFTPGPGVGGHCLPIDPSYLSWQVRRTLGQSFRFVELANDVNEHMPDYVASRVTEHLNRQRKSVNGANVVLVGLAYKADSGDARESPAIAVAERLHRLGAVLSAADPMVDPRHVPQHIALVDLDDQVLDMADVIVVLTDHSAFDWDAIARHADKILDTRNRLPQHGVDRL